MELVIVSSPLLETHVSKETPLGEIGTIFPIHSYYYYCSGQDFRVV